MLNALADYLLEDFEIGDPIGALPLCTPCFFLLALLAWVDEYIACSTEGLGPFLSEHIGTKEKKLNIPGFTKMFHQLWTVSF